MNDLHFNQCPDMLQLMDLVLTLPAHSADCKRGFSHAKLVKNDWRNKLRDTAVTDSLTVILHTPAEVKYNPEDAVHHWNAKTVRRPNQVCGSTREDSDSEESDTEDCYLEAALSRLAESAE